MKTFNDLEFTQHSQYPLLDQQALMDFPNGYGISVVTGEHAYANTNTYEVAVLNNDALCYDTPITDDVVGHCTESKVTEIMKQIQKLKKSK